ncbi:MAG: hypothetical protein ACP5SI_00115 [Chloroflexia bacterium]
MKRVGACEAFRRGIDLVVRFWPVVILFYGMLLVISAAVLFPAQRALARALGHRLALQELADGVDPWVVAAAIRALWHDPEAVSRSLGPVVLSLPAWPLMANLPFVLLSAGALSVYVRKERTLWCGFGTGLVRWSPSFLALLLGETVLLEGTLIATLALVGLAYLRAPAVGLAFTLAAIPLWSAFALLLPWWFGYARVWIAVHRRARLGEALVGAWRFLWRNLGAASVLELLLVAGAAGVGVLQFLAGRLLSDGWWGARLVAEQLLVAVLVGIRLARLAAQAGLLEGRPVPQAGS